MSQLIAKDEYTLLREHKFIPIRSIGHNSQDDKRSHCDIKCSKRPRGSNTGWVPLLIMTHVNWTVIRNSNPIFRALRVFRKQFLVAHVFAECLGSTSRRLEESNIRSLLRLIPRARKHLHPCPKKARSGWALTPLVSRERPKQRVNWTSPVS